MTSFIFARIDFVDFVWRRDFMSLDLPEYTETEGFLEATCHFVELITNLGQTIWRLKYIPNSKIKKESFTSNPSLAKAIALISYRGLLPSDDPRYVVLPGLGTIPSQERRSLNSLYPSSIPLTEGGSLLQFTDIENADAEEYLSHWSKAFPDVLSSMLNSVALINRILYTDLEDGSNAVLDEIGSIISGFDIDLPLLDKRLRNKFIIDFYFRVRNRLIVIP